MPSEPARALQLDLFAGGSPVYQDALAHYEALRPVLKRERTLARHSRATGINYSRLWRDQRRFARDGFPGLIDRLQLRHQWAKPAIAARLPQHIQQYIVRLAITHPFTTHEPARIIGDGYHYPVDHRGIRRVLDGQLLHSILLIDGYSRAIVGVGCRSC